MKRTIKKLDVKRLEKLAYYNLFDFFKKIGTSTTASLETEWAGLREYTPEDDTKRIDWIASARVGKLVVREYEPEKENTVMLMLDTSESMGLGSVNTLIEQGAIACATLALLAIKSKDNVGFASFSSKLRNVILPSKGERQFYLILRSLRNLKAMGSTNIRRSIEDALKILRRRSLLFIITDLCDKPQEVARGVLQAKAQGHKVFFIQVFERDPITPILEQGITKIKLRGKKIDLRKDRSLILTILEEKRRNFRKKLARLGAEIIQVEINELPEQMIMRYIIAKSRSLVAR